MLRKLVSDLLLDMDEVGRIRATARPSGPRAEDGLQARGGGQQEHPRPPARRLKRRDWWI